MNTPIKACGILFCYNEEHIIADTIGHYLSEGIDLVIIDNDSQDSSLEIISGFREKRQEKGKIIEILNIKTQGYEWRKILKYACDYMHKRLTGYDWILLIDADAFYRSPVRGIDLLGFISYAEHRGYNIIAGKVLDFYPTKIDDNSISSAVKRLHFFSPERTRIQHKIFKYHPSIDFFSYWGHICLRKDPKVFTVRFLYLHYPWISYEHGLKKIFAERKPRFVERREYPYANHEYARLLPLEKDLLKDPNSLKKFEENKLLMSPQRFSLILALRLFPDAYNQIKEAFCRRYLAASRTCLKLPLILIKLDWRLAFSYSYLIFREKFFKRPGLKKGFEDRLPQKNRHIMSLEEIIQQEPFATGFPKAYHFLLTHRCNARCLFCNQKQRTGETDEITLQKFKAITAHMPLDIGTTIYLSGGGEPFLAQDFMRIVHFISKAFPHIKLYIVTNGLLLKDFASELAQARITEIRISIHGGTRINNDILGATNSEAVFEGIELLRKANSEIRISICPCLLRLNIDELPALVRKASSLGVARVTTSFCRFYTLGLNGADDSIDPKNSLFFDQRRYNQRIRQAEQEARADRIVFTHEPLFSQRFVERPCLQPWENMVIDSDGQVYPCTGGEVRFYGSVKSGKYNFGNLLAEEFWRCWNSDSYIALRRTLNPRFKEEFIPECKNCHNQICLKGPGLADRHIIANTA